MNKVTPTINKDGTETVELYGTIVDVTGEDTFTLFKKEYKVERPKKAKKPKKPKKDETVEVADDEQ